MCGINAYFSSKRSQEEIELILKKMNQIIIHRGPDDEGIYVEKIKNSTIGLGQVRLAIVDLSPDGHQPMHFEHKKRKVSIVFNGEIYNFQELKKQLQKKGYKFKNKTDTEVIMASYLEKGANCVKDLNGMWGFVLYDHQKNIVFCSRDIAGEKPIYYYHAENEFIVSSEIKGIVSTNPALKKVNKDAVDFYLSCGYIPAPYSIYQGINKLPARHNLIYDPTNNSIKIDEYFKIPPYTPQKKIKKLIEEGKSILHDSIKIRTFADVPVGSFLSGGIDSSSVVAEMKNIIGNQNLHTFSIGFDQKQYDETKFIKIMQKKTKSIHHHYTFTKENFENLLEDVSYYYDEPFADYSNFPVMKLSKETKKHVTVALTGDGGDEIFGGYQIHHLAIYLDILYRLPKRLKKTLYYLVPRNKDSLGLFSKFKEAIRVTLYPKDEFYARLMETTSHKADVYKKRSIEIMEKLLKVNQDNIVQSIIDFDLYYNTLPENFLTKVDRGSMKHALECRAPFLDPRFLKLAKKIPIDQKVTFMNSKILLKKIVKGLVPKKIIKRRKMGFHPPINKRIMGKSFTKKNTEELEKLVSNGIISKERYKFYTETVFKNDNLLYQIYRIRLYMFINRYQTWISGETSKKR